MLHQPLDARQRRTRAALHRAVIELAGERSPRDISVTALAERAGVHRSTVYEHGEGTVDLLRRALSAELDALREQHLRDVPPERAAEALRAVTLGVFAHVESHADVYRNLRGAGAATLHGFLGEHFRTSTRLLLEQSSLTIPVAVPGIQPEAVRELAVAYIADGVVGLIGGWLDDPEPHDPEALLAVFAQLAPAWWPFSSPPR